MTTPSQISPPRNSQQQRGAAILIMVLILMLGLITLFTFRMDRRGPELEADRKTALALAQAKQALLGWAAIDGGGTNPGRLPCPDQDNDGGSEGAACASPYLGRVPWKTLGIEDLRDGASERLWYIVDNNFRSKILPINTTNASVLTFNGQQIVAAVIAPGTTLSSLSQNRSTTGLPTPSNIYTNYLESYAPTTISLTSVSPSDTFNDRILVITPTELFTVVTFRMARELAKANGVYPQTATTIAGLMKPLVWSDNNWDAAIEGDGTTSNVIPAKITLKFKNCAIIYIITGSGSVSRDINSC